MMMYRRGERGNFNNQAHLSDAILLTEVGNIGAHLKTFLIDQIR